MLWKQAAAPPSGVGFVSAPTISYQGCCRREFPHFLVGLHSDIIRTTSQVLEFLLR